VDRRTGTLGDIIVSANNKPVQRLSDLTGELDETGIGHDVKLGIMRDSRQETISVAVVDVGQSQLGE
jgi:2-alkenal reductase